jgi:phage terminase large subunit
MSCGCENRKLSVEYERIASLAKKAAMLDRCNYVVYIRPDGTYAFDKEGTEIEGKIVEYKFYP